MPRTYTMRRRAERQAETRQRIVDAATTLLRQGPTSMTAIADAAGVGRVTLYRHFPDEGSLIDATIERLFAACPVPVGPPGDAGVDREQRLRAVLGDLYRYYEDVRGIIEAGLSNAGGASVPERLPAPLAAALDQAEAAIVEDWPGASPGSLVSGAIHHALAYGTWRSLRQTQGLTTAEAVDLMAGLIRAASGSMPVDRPRPAARSTR